MKADYRSIYIAFDPHPSYKGASTHIQHMVEVLAKVYAPTLLLTLPGSLPSVSTPAIDHLQFETTETNFLKKTTAFTQWVKSILDQQHQLLVGHYRDAWGGMALVSFPHIHTIFEVNGLPSIELPYRYPELSQDTLQKIVRIEQHCLDQAAAIVTPSYTTRKYLTQRGLPNSKIRVIPNGAIIPPPMAFPRGLPPTYMVYMGGLQPWQGIQVLLKAFRYLHDVDIPLVICCSHSAHYSKPYVKHIEKLGLTNKVIWLYQLDKDQLNQVLQHALFSVAPLTECSRNIEQGCSPLKILESMACGTPVIASQLPAVEEIITHHKDGLLCRPGRPADLARAIRVAADYPAHMAELGQRAQAKIREKFMWHHARNSLEDLYNQILIFSF